MSNEIKNAPDNRDREDNATIKTDADEVSGSSDCSFSVGSLRSTFLKDHDTTDFGHRFPGGQNPFRSFEGKIIKEVTWLPAGIRITFTDNTIGYVDIFMNRNDVSEQTVKKMSSMDLFVGGGLRNDAKFTQPIGRRIKV